jgi:hypothetical protein
MTDQNWIMADDIAKWLSERRKWLNHVDLWAHGVKWRASTRSGHSLDRGHGVNTGCTKIVMHTWSVTHACDRWCTGLTGPDSWLVGPGDE